MDDLTDEFYLLYRYFRWRRYWARRMRTHVQRRNAEVARRWPAGERQFTLDGRRYEIKPYEKG